VTSRENIGAGLNQPHVLQWQPNQCGVVKRKFAGILLKFKDVRHYRTQTSVRHPRLASKKTRFAEGRRSVIYSAHLGGGNLYGRGQFPESLDTSVLRARDAI
jgi:hypothetical protein